MKDILLVGCARVDSTRIQRKMTHPFANSTLFDIYLDKFEHIKRKNHPFSNIIMAVHKNDKYLWEKTIDSTIQHVERNDESITLDGHLDKVYHFLKDFDEEYICVVNGCAPFLRPESIMHIAEFFKQLPDVKSLTCGINRYNYFYDAEKKKLINRSSGNDIDTKHVTPLIELAHCIHIYPRKTLLKTGFYWDWTHDNPFVYTMPDELEGLDINTGLDFEICEALWEKKC